MFPFTDGRRVEPFTPIADNKVPSKDDIGEITSQNRQHLRFHGNFKELASVPELQATEELSIVLDDDGDGGRRCKVTIIKPDEIQCDLNKLGIVEGQDYPVYIKVGHRK